METDREGALLLPLPLVMEVVRWLLAMLVVLLVIGEDAVATAKKKMLRCRFCGNELADPDQIEDIPMSSEVSILCLCLSLSLCDRFFR